MNCELPSHHKKSFEWICLNPICKMERLNCSKCILSNHLSCKNYLSHLKNLQTQSFSKNPSLLENTDIMNCAILIEKYMLEESTDRLINHYITKINEEIVVIQENFLNQLHKSKEVMINTFKNSLEEERTRITKFCQELREFYGFDKLSIFSNNVYSQKFQKQNLEQDLQDHLKNLKQIKNKEAELHKFSKKINLLVHSSFENIKHNLKSHPEKIHSENTVTKTWKWDDGNKSEKINFSEENRAAKKIESSFSYSGVISNISMKEGNYKWNLEIITGNSQNQLVIFGIISSRPSNMDNIPFNEILGYTSYGQILKMVKYSNSPQISDGIIFNMELDFKKGCFIIKNGEKVICREDNNIKGKEFYAVVILYKSGNMIKLKF